MVDILGQELEIGDVVSASFNPKWDKKIKIGVIEKLNPKSATILYKPHSWNNKLETATPNYPDKCMFKLPISERKWFWKMNLDEKDLLQLEELFLINDNKPQ